MQIELEAGEEQHERQSQKGHHLDGFVELGPAEYLRPDHDAQEDLHHGDWDAYRFQSVDEERRTEGRHRDDREAVEGQVAHSTSSAPYLRRMRSATSAVQPV